MKKILSILTLLFLPTIFFSQNAFEEKIKEAQLYEESGLTIHALGSYYDACEMEPNEKGLKAYNEFKRLESAVRNGKPSDQYYDFGEYEFYHDWKNLALEYEDYWLEESPAYFTFDGFRLSEGNRNGYFTYVFSFDADWTPKYEKIKNIVSEGFNSVDGYGLSGFPDDWPTTTIKNPGDRGYACLEKFDYYYDYYTEENFNLPCYEECFYYQLNFDIEDLEGNVLLSDITVMAQTFDYVRNVNYDFARILEDEDYLIKIKSVKLVAPTGDSYWDEVKDTYVESVEETNLLLDENVLVIFNEEDEPTDAIKKIENIKKEEARQKQKQIAEQQKKEATKKLAEDFTNNMIKISNGKLVKGEIAYSLSSFLITKTEITQSVYEAITNDNPSKMIYEESPVENVSWFDAIYFCNKLSSLSGKNPCYSVDGETDVDKWQYSPHSNQIIEGKISCDFNANGFRLPTNAEWEFVAMEGKNSFNIYSGSNTANDVAWFSKNSKGTTHSVATKSANALGIFDLSGNVWEWCWDYYSEDFQETKNENPIGASQGEYKTVRGGSYANSYSLCAVSSIDGYLPNFRNSRIGFRIVCNGK